MASMGPRLFRRGNDGDVERFIGSERLLQWGHAFSDVEMEEEEEPPVEEEEASMGPRLFRRGNRVDQGVS